MTHNYPLHIGNIPDFFKKNYKLHVKFISLGVKSIAYQTKMGQVIDKTLNLPITDSDKSYDLLYRYDDLYLYKHSKLFILQQICICNLLFNFINF